MYMSLGHIHQFPIGVNEIFVADWRFWVFTKVDNNGILMSLGHQDAIHIQFLISLITKMQEKTVFSVERLT